MEINTFVKVLLSTFIFLLFLSCNKGREIDVFYSDLLDHVEPKEIAIFKSKKVDSTGAIIGLMYDEVKKNYDELSQDSGVRYLLDIYCENYDSIKINFLIIGFHDYCNKRQFDPKKIKSKIIMMNEYKSRLAKEKFYEKRGKISKMNNSKFIIGDTVEVCLPIRKHDDVMVTFYYGEIPDDYNCIDYNTVNISGKIIKKRYDLYSNADELDLVFELVLLSSSDFDVKIGRNLRCIGDTINLYVTQYSRLITRPIPRKTVTK